MEDFGLQADKLAALDRYIDGLTDPEDQLIGLLHKAQEMFGCLPKALQVHIAQKTGIPASKIYGVVSGGLQLGAGHVH